MRPRKRTTLMIAIAAALAVAVIAVFVVITQSGSEGRYRVVDGKLTVSAGALGTFGTVLVTDQGYALYTFPPDNQKGVTCYDRCAQTWPPVIVPKGTTLVAGTGVAGSRLAETTDRDGKQIATYDGWPLYTYLGDVTAGTATGQAQFLDGGYWYLIRPDGEIVKPGK